MEQNCRGSQTGSCHSTIAKSNGLYYLQELVETWCLGGGKQIRRGLFQQVVSGRIKAWDLKSAMEERTIIGLRRSDKWVGFRD